MIFGTWEEVQAHSSLHTISPPSDSTVSALPIGPYVCVTCQAEFVQLADMQAHEKLHPKPRPHVCDQCGKGFLNKAGLRKHQRIIRPVGHIAALFAERLFFSPPTFANTYAPTATLSPHPPCLRQI